MNRPVHLARRDAFYLKALERIQTLPKFPDPATQQRIVAEAHYLLREARRHARVANLSKLTSDSSRLFVKFLSLLIDHTQSLMHLLERIRMLSEGDHAIDLFLEISPEEREVITAPYRDCASSLISSLTSLLERAEGPARALRNTSLVKMPVDAKARYEKAFRHFEEQADGEARIGGEFPDPRIDPSKDE